MTQWYILDEDKRPQSCGVCNGKENFEYWAQRNSHLLTVNLTNIGSSTIETIFLGEDVGAGGGGPYALYKPVVFRSKVTGGYLDGMERYYTDWNQAEDGHESLINAVKSARFTYSNCLNWAKRRGSQIWIKISRAWQSWLRL
jgi:hypothetical protein